jgi:hypothetical protein
MGFKLKYILFEVLTRFQSQRSETKDAISQSISSGRQGSNTGVASINSLPFPSIPSVGGERESGFLQRASLIFLSRHKGMRVTAKTKVWPMARIIILKGSTRRDPVDSHMQPACLKESSPHSFPFRYTNFNMLLFFLLSSQVLAAISRFQRDSLLRDMTPIATSSGPSGSILVAGSTLDTPGLRVKSIQKSTSLSVGWSKQYPCPAGCLGSRPVDQSSFGSVNSAMVSADGKTYLLSTDRYADSFKMVLLAIDSATGALVSRIPIASTDPSVSFTVAKSIILSKSSPNKAYIIASAAGNNKISGYAAQRINLLTNKVDWTSKFLSAGENALESGIEIGSNLYLVGSSGLVTITSTGVASRISIVNTPRLLTAVASADSKQVLVSAFETTFAVDVATKKVVWTKALPGMVQGTLSNGDIFISGLDSSSFNTGDWFPRISSINPTTGSQRYPTVLMRDSRSFTGMASTGTKASVLVTTNTKTGCRFFGLFCKTVPAMQLRQYDSLGKLVFPSSTTETTTSLSLGTTSGASLMGSSADKVWAISYEGIISVWNL